MNHMLYESPTFIFIQELNEVEKEAKKSGNYI